MELCEEKLAMQAAGLTIVQARAWQLMHAWHGMYDVF